MTKGVIAGVVAGVVAIVAVIVVLSLTTVSTPPDQVALHYKAGPFSSTKFADCVPTSTRKWFGPGDKTFSYPVSQRVYDATGAKGAESAPFTVVSADNAELRVPVTVTFTLVSDCQKLREFHDRIGNRYHAYFDGSEAPEGWISMLNLYIGKPLDTTLDRVAQGYTWRAMWNDPKVKAAMETAVNENLETIVNRQAGGDYFERFQVLMQKPDPVNENLKKAVADEQASVAAANSAKAKADADRAAAEAQVAVAQAEAAKVAAAVRVLGIDGYLKSQAIAKGINPYQPTAGSLITDQRP